MLTRAATMICATILMIACGGGSKSPADADNDKHPDTTDCAPNDSRTWQQLAFKSQDVDGDGVASNTFGQVCSGTALPAGYFVNAVQVADADCDDSDRTRWARREFTSRDADNDGHRVNEGGFLCVGAALPAGYFPDVVDAAAVDCSDTDATRWVYIPYLGLDRDGDGYPADDAGTLCWSPTPLPAGYFATVATALRDCADADATRWRISSVYRDQDGDGVGAGARTTSCIGRLPPAGFSLKGFDPNDDAADPNAALVSDFDLPPLLREPPQEADEDDFP